MNYLKLHILLFIIVSNTSYGQLFVKPVHVEWHPIVAAKHNLSSVDDLRFTECDTYDKNLPAISFKFPVSSDLNLLNTSVTIEVLEKNPKNCSPALHAYFASEPTFVYNFFKERNINYLVGFLVPLSQSQNNKLQLISKAQIIISAKKNQASGLHNSKNFSFKSSSILKDGEWVKMAVSESKIYRISFQNLTNFGFSNPEHVAIYSSPNGLLPRMNAYTSSDDLSEIATWIDHNYLYFYGESPHKLAYDLEQSRIIYNSHLYSNENYYYLKSQSGSVNRVEQASISTQSPDHLATSFDELIHHELDSLNLISSGRDWYGEHFDIVNNHHFDFKLEALDHSSGIQLHAQTLCRSKSPLQENLMQILLNSYELLLELKHYPTDDSPTNPYATLASGEVSFYSPEENFSIDFIFSKPSNYSEAWLDYFSIQYRKQLMFQNNLHFRDLSSVGPENTTTFKITNAPSDLIVWDISENTSPKRISVELNAENASFNVETDSLREFLAFSPSETYEAPVYLGRIENQNLHALSNIDYLIISAEEFVDLAEELAALHRKDGLNAYVSTCEKIYNEYSGGKTDISSIRNFIRHLYLKETAKSTLKYVLFMGDGSYDNRFHQLDKNKFIPTYQSENSLVPVQSYVSDDYFGLLDENEGESEGLLDIGIGRFPVRTKQEVKTIINKITQYLELDSDVNWQQKIVFIADDEDNNIHLEQADQLAEQIELFNPEYEVQKIYLDAYPEVNTGSGLSNPECNATINHTINRGALLVNYTGHGGPFGLTTERVINVNDVIGWTNDKKYPVFMTATCEFSQFDDIQNTSGGELTLLNNNGGAVALFSTTRKVYSTPNFILNLRFYEHVFNDSLSRLGDILRLTKTNSGSGINKRNFTLLGDPALKFKNPSEIVRIDSLNNQAINNFTDTLHGLDEIRITGVILGKDSLLNSSFNGFVYLTFFAQKNHLQTLGNSNNTATSFDQFTDKIIDIKCTVEAGKWASVFVLPLKLKELIGSGKIILHGTDQSSGRAANGSIGSINLGGSGNVGANDATGPIIKAFLNDEQFENGQTIQPEPVLYINLFDSLGINSTSLGIAHDISLMIDSTQLVVLNDFFEPEVDSYQAGSITYSLGKLNPGHHTLKIKAFDIADNPSEKHLEFLISDDIQPSLKRVFNYPNPFTESTGFHFVQNLEGIEYRVSVRILTVSGKMVRTIETVAYCDKYLSDSIRWDGHDDFGNELGRGVYIYELSIQSPSGKRDSLIEKLVLLR